MVWRCREFFFSNIFGFKFFSTIFFGVFYFLGHFLFLGIEICAQRINIKQKLLILCYGGAASFFSNIFGFYNFVRPDLVENYSISLSCTVFNFPSAGYNPGWIYWSYEFLFFRPRGLRTQRPAQTGPGCQNPAFQRFDSMTLCSFLWRFRKTKLESHNSKQILVYEQIAFL